LQLESQIKETKSSLEYRFNASLFFPLDYKVDHCGLCKNAMNDNDDDHHDDNGTLGA
jgi:hypothetical protein